MAWTGTGFATRGAIAPRGAGHYLRGMSTDTPSPAPAAPAPAAPPAAPEGAATPAPKEVGGPTGPDPTRFGDWERKGRCIDF